MSTSAQDIVDACEAALLRIAQYGSAVGMNGDTLTEANIPDLHKTIAQYKAQITAAASPTTGGLRICKVTPKGMN